MNILKQLKDQKAVREELYTANINSRPDDRRTYPCPTCGFMVEPVAEFGFLPSVGIREWKISGMCLSCQRKTFQ